MDAPRVRIPVYSKIEELLVGIFEKFGVTFEREYKIGPYYADIFIPQGKIVVECDGEEWHQDKERDRRRDEYMQKRGFKVFRFTGSEIFIDRIACAEKVMQHIIPWPAEYESYMQSL